MEYPRRNPEFEAEPAVEPAPHSEKTPEAAAEAERIIDESLAKLLERHMERLNEGNNALILKLDDGSLPKELIDNLREQGVDVNAEMVTKVLKVYQPGRGRQEFESQKLAYDIMAPYRDNPEYARVPRPHFIRDIKVNEETMRRLNRFSNTPIGGNNVELIMMDEVDGQDVATEMFREVIRRHPKTQHLIGSLKDMPFPELMTTAYEALGGAVPGGKGRTEAEREFEEWKVYNQNAQLLHRFLERSGYRVDERVVQQLENTLRVFHENGLVLRDAHHRNFMVQGSLSHSPETQPRAFVIDYGMAKKFNGPFTDELYREGDVRFVDDLAVARELKTLAKSPAEREAGPSRELLKQLNDKRRLLDRRPEHPLVVLRDRWLATPPDQIDLAAVYNSCPGGIEAKAENFMMLALALLEANKIDQAKLSGYVHARINVAPIVERNRLVTFLKGLS